MFQTIGSSDSEPLAVVVRSIHEHIIVNNNALNLQISFFSSFF